MSSGVKVEDSVKKLFNTMKVRKKDYDERELLRFIILKIESGTIVEDKIITQKDLEGEDDHFQYFRKQLPDKKCCYVLYDCHYENDVSKKEDLVFLLWAPDNASVSDKMLYASSKDALTKVFTGVKFIIQVNDPDECDMIYFADLFGKNTVKIEGCSVKSSNKKGH